MKKVASKVMALVAVCALLLGTTTIAAPAAPDLGGAVSGAVQDLYAAVQKPTTGVVGGEWAIMALARSGAVQSATVPPQAYYDAYYATVTDLVTETKGVLHEKKYTEYARTILTLTAIGRDPRSVAGYDLTLPLGDYEKTIWQGLNGPIWALIALDTANYPMPQNQTAATQATRQLYVQRILDCQNSDGGFSLTGGTAAAGAQETSDADITGMALQALAKYQTQPAVKMATEEALACMSARQQADGGFASYGVANAESVVQMIVGITELGLPLNDARFVKNGHTLVDNLLTYYKAGTGFLHVKDAEANQMATEQGTYALVAAQRAARNLPSLYRMSDAPRAETAPAQNIAGQGLAGKNPAISAPVATLLGVSFSDVSAAQPNRVAIEALAARGVLSGKTAGVFVPDGAITRAEMAKICVKSFTLTGTAAADFPDVAVDAWYAGAVGAVREIGLMNGNTDGTFSPDKPISHEAVAVMLTNAAKLCGLDTAMDTVTQRDTLAAFDDYTTSAAWARPALAFCYANGIFDASAALIAPKADCTRAELAQMMWNLLGAANLQ